MVTQLHIHVYILFFHIIVLYHKWLDIVSSATQQDLIANPFWRQKSAITNPKLSVHPIPSPSPLATTSKSILQVHDFLFCGKVPLCFILYSSYKRYHMVFVFFFLTYFTQDESLCFHPCCCKWHYFVLFMAEWYSTVYIYHIFLIFKIETKGIIKIKRSA